MEHGMFLDPGRKVFQINGNDRYRFLQGLITQNIGLLEKKMQKGIYSALLTPTGRFLFDFFVLSDEESLYLISHEAEALLNRIKPYKLRLDVNFIPLFDTHKVYGSITPPSGELTFQDPRHPELGYWRVSDEPLQGKNDYSEYIHHRFHLGIPEGNDLEKERAIILEWGFEELNGISFTKGCYMGQELMSRTKHLGQIRKRILPIQFDETHGNFNIGDIIQYQDEEVGEIKAKHNYLALAMIRLDMIPLHDNSTIPIKVNHDKAIIYKPNWIKI